MRTQPKWRSILVAAVVLLLGGAWLAVHRAWSDPHSEAGGGAKENSVLRLEEEDSVPLGTGSPFGRISRAQARARVNSLFAIKAGEIGIIGLPAGDFGRYFDFIDPKTDFERNMPGLVMGVRASDRSNREALEKILMKGGRLSSKIGSAGGSLAFSGERIRGQVTPKGDGNQLVQDLGFELFGDDGQTTMRTGITVFKGSPLFFRSSYPDPEVFLIIVGKNEDSPE